MLSLEGTGSRMSNQARNEIYFQRTVSADETLRAIDAVTSGEVTKLARRIFSRPLTLAVIGNLDGAKLRVPTIA
jgi:predicted Zn-dependent peptidase